MEHPVNTVEHLRQHGIRPSVQRIAVMDYLLTHRSHPTAETIYGSLAPGMPTLSRTTVYNTLSLFAAQGAAIHITLDPRGSRFDGDTSAHGHFLCTQCGSLYDIFFETAPALPPVCGGHTATEAQVYYKGTCRHCNEQSNNK